MHRLEVVHADITKLEVDAIVNAANEWMLGGGGVDGAIHDAAGPELVEACRAHTVLRPGVRCPTGEARVTDGFALPARWVVHTVGPEWRGGKRGEPELLASAYAQSLAVAVAAGARSIAFPSISTGAFLYPLHSASVIAVRECARFLRRYATFEKILLVAYRREEARVLQKVLDAARAELARRGEMH